MREITNIHSNDVAELMGMCRWEHKTSPNLKSYLITISHSMKHANGLVL